VDRCRKRSFALFFEGGEDEAVAREHVGECRPWPQHFREKKALCGLAAAAIVSATPKDNEAQPLESLTSSAVPRCLGTYPYSAVLGHHMHLAFPSYYDPHVKNSRNCASVFRSGQKNVSLNVSYCLYAAETGVIKALSVK